MTVSGMSMETFESRIKAIVFKALSQCPGPSGLMPLQLSLVMLLMNKCYSHQIFASIRGVEKVDGCELAMEKTCE